MLSTDHIFQFKTKICKYDFGKYYYTVVFLPANLVSKLPLKQYPKLRVNANIEGLIIEGAFMPDKGSWYLMISRKNLKLLGKALGDEIEIRFNVADQGHVSLPQELELELKQNEDFKARWDNLTSGKQRGLAYSLSKIKSPEIRERKLLQIIESI